MLDWKLVAGVIWVFIGCAFVLGPFAFPLMNWWQILLFLMLALAFIGSAESFFKFLENK